MDRLPLYQIPEAFRALERLIDQATDESEGEIPATLEAELDCLNANLDDRVDAVAIVVKRADSRAAYAEGQYRAFQALVEGEVTRWKIRKRVAENLAARMKEYLKHHLQAMGRKDHETADFKVRIQKNGGLPSVRWLGREADIPKEYQKVSIDVDTDKVIADWKAGKPLPEGFEVTVGNHLRIT